MTYRLIKKEEISRAADSVTAAEKKSITLLGGKEEPYAVYIVVVNQVKGRAEVHARAHDVWYVLSGSAKFILGGALKDGFEKRQGEWVAEDIEGGETFVAKPGDSIVVPSQIPHQIDARGNRVEFLIVKINIT